MKNDPISCAIIGAGGYTGAELIKLLLQHPRFEISYLGVREQGAKLKELHPFLQDILNLDVHVTNPKEVAKCCDIAFLALPHKTSMEVAKALLELGVKVIDLSADYRLELETYETHYTHHTDPSNLEHAVYGLPEINRDEIKRARLVANPGCYPTASILALLPFLDMIDARTPIFIDAKSGVSGAGAKCKPTTHFGHINENIFAYSPITHRHGPEISEKLHAASNKNFDITFVPHLLPVTRGMLVSAYATLRHEIDASALLQEYYKDETFIRIRETPADIKSTAGTNFCDIFVTSRDNALFVSSSIDNLLRGASSQAVVNANLMCGLDEHLGVPTIAYIP
jgi:N-acetyl-gamma-glutamyl-phosphate reductase